MTIDTCIQNMTLSEKATLLQGKTNWTTHNIPRLEIPSIFLSDGPHGLRKQSGAEDHLGLNASVPATCFPTAATMANSWDPELGEELGRALGQAFSSYFGTSSIEVGASKPNCVRFTAYLPVFLIVTLILTESPGATRPLYRSSISTSTYDAFPSLS